MTADTTPAVRIVPEPPVHLSADAAYGWTCGYEAALAALSPSREGVEPPISLDGPHKPGEQRQWLARQLLDSRLDDEEAFSVVAFHPDIKDAREGVGPEAGAVALSRTITEQTQADIAPVNPEELQAAFDAIDRAKAAHPTPADDRLAVAWKWEQWSSLSGAWTDRLTFERPAEHKNVRNVEALALLTKSGEAEG